MLVIALVISYVMYYNGTKKELLKNVDNVMDEIMFDVKNDNILDDIVQVYEYILSNYKEEQPVFNDENEKRDYYRDTYSQIYPPKAGKMGFSRLTGQYTVILSFLRSEAIAANSTVYISMINWDTNDMIYIADSRDDVKGIYYYAGSNYKLTQNDLNSKIVASEGVSNYDEMTINGKTSKLNSISQEESPVVYNGYTLCISIEYNLNKVASVANDFLKTGLIFFSIGFVALLVLYYFISDRLFVKNIIKLNNATKEFSESLDTNDIKVIETNIKSKDEINELANSFEILEKGIIDYSIRIEKEALERETLNAEISVASKIQLETLPQNSFADKNVLLDAYIKPAKGVGGDFYDYFYLDDNKLAIVISDVSGKGIPAALFMMKSKELLKSMLLKNSNLEEVLFNVNNLLLENNDEGLFITAFVGIIDYSNLNMRFINAGHEKPYLISNGKVIKLGNESNFIVGGLQDYVFKEESVNLNKNDKIFLFTDGLNESIDSSRNEFGYESIIKLLENNIDSDNKNIIENMNNSLSNFSSCNEQFDDITMMVLQIKDDKLSFKFEKPTLDIIDIVVDKFNNYYSFVDQKILSEINIIFDEMLNNYVTYEKNNDLFIEVNIKLENNMIIINFVNNGEEFNPLIKNEKYIEKDDENLQIGGFGITIVKNLSDDISYERKNDNNMLTIKKIIKK